MSSDRKTLSLVKGRHRFVFQYASGREAELVGAFVGLANDPRSEFDWYDAAILSYQMGRQCEHDLDHARDGADRTDAPHAARKDTRND